MTKLDDKFIEYFNPINVYTRLLDYHLYDVKELKKLIITEYVPFYKKLRKMSLPKD